MTSSPPSLALAIKDGHIYKSKHVIKWSGKYHITDHFTMLNYPKINKVKLRNKKIFFFLIKNLDFLIKIATWWFSITQFCTRFQIAFFLTIHLTKICIDYKCSLVFFFLLCEEKGYIGITSFFNER